MQMCVGQDAIPKYVEVKARKDHKHFFFGFFFLKCSKEILNGKE